MPEISRFNAEDARLVVEKLLPQKDIRRQVVAFFCNAIRKGHEQGAAKREVTLKGGRPPLQKGRTYSNTPEARRARLLPPPDRLSGRPGPP